MTRLARPLAALLLAFCPALSWAQARVPAVRAPLASSRGAAAARPALAARPTRPLTLSVRSAPPALPAAALASRAWGARPALLSSTPEPGRQGAGPALSDLARQMAEQAAPDRSPGEEAPSAEPARAPAPARRGAWSALFSALFGRGAPAAFDASRRGGGSGGAGLRGDDGKKPILFPSRARLGPAPSRPGETDASGVVLRKFVLEDAGASPEGGAAGAPDALDADPADAASVERALRARLDAAGANLYAGVRGGDIRTVHVQKDARPGYADTYYAVFQQTHGGLPVEGTYVAFTVKVIEGRARVYAENGRLEKDLRVPVGASLADAEAFELIARRTGLSPREAAESFRFHAQKIVFDAKTRAWRNARLYTADVPLRDAAGRRVQASVVVAVDVNDKDVFAWDNRAGAAGRLLGRRTAGRGPARPDSAMVEAPIPYATVTLSNGRTLQADKNGEFVVDATLAPEPGQFTATLTSPYARVVDRQGKTLSVSGSFAPGQPASVVYNPGAGGSDEASVAQVTAYVFFHALRDFVKSLGIDDKRLDMQLPIYTNVPGAGNAYYTPRNPSLNFLRGDATFSNAAFPSVVMHEGGHWIDDMINGIEDGGLSEGWGDIFSMFFLGSPIIGEGFLRTPREGRDYIRHGENARRYDPSDEVHAQGEVWGGFGWKLLKRKIARLGAEAGAAAAGRLVFPTIFAKSYSIPDAISQVLLNALRPDGSVNPDDAEDIRASASAHGIDLSGKSGAQLQNLLAVGETSVERADRSWLGWLSDLASPLLGGSPAYRATLRFAAGSAVRERFEEELTSRIAPAPGLSRRLTRYDGRHASSFSVVLEGPRKAVLAREAELEAWFRSLSASRTAD